MPEVYSVDPKSGWPGPNGTGTMVVITGTGFHPTPAMDLNQVTFNGANNTRAPAAITFASPNEIEYVADRAIEDQDPFAGTAPYTLGFTGLEGLAISDRGLLYIAVTGQNTAKWGVPGSWGIRFFPYVAPHRFDRPSGVAVDDDGNVYLANSGLHRIEQYGPGFLGSDINGNPLPVWGSQGAGNDQFQFPRAVDVATINGETFVFIADTYNQRVVRTRTDGSDFRVFNMPAGAGTIQGVAAHAAGDVYCSDPGSRRILHFDADGNFLNEFGASDLRYPMGLDVDFDGFIYVVDNRTRTVKKFGLDFRLLAEFGLNPGQQPQVTPPEELVDPVDVAVGLDKAVWIADRARNHIVKWIPKDSQQIFVTVPVGAVSGTVQVETADGPAGFQPFFRVLEVGEVSVNRWWVTQGIEEYPLVCKKKTAVFVEMSTPVTGEFPNNRPLSSWRNPATDTTILTIRRDGVDVETITDFQILPAEYSDASLEAIFKLFFELPVQSLSVQGEYEFEIVLSRPGFLSFNDSIRKQALPRRRLKIGAYALSHLRPDGTPNLNSDLPETLYSFGGDDTATLAWLDWSNMLSGFAVFNRTFPAAHSLYDIQLLPPRLISGIADGITDNEAEYIQELMESERLIMNEKTDIPFDVLLAVVDRTITPDNWIGASFPADGWKTAIVSLGKDSAGLPVQDFGVVIAHEVAHLFYIVNEFSPRLVSKGESSNDFVQTAFPAWNSLFGTLVDQPISIMFDPQDQRVRVVLDDINGYFEAFFDGEPAADYPDLFNQLPNPHPERLNRQELALDSSPVAPKRPAGSKGNLTVLGTIPKKGPAKVRYSHVGRGDTPVTPLIKTGYELVQVGPKKKSLLRWPVPVGFDLVARSAVGTSGSGAAPLGGFRVTAPWMEATVEVRLEHNGNVLVTTAVPRGFPSVEIIEPHGGEQLGINDVLDIRWNATHPNNAPLVFHVEYSTDGGNTFQLIQAGLRQTTLSWHNRAFPGSNKAVIRVVASDGFHSASDDSPAFFVEPKSPRVRVIWPPNGKVIAQGQPVRMIASAWDPEQGPLGGRAITWLLDELIPLGEGNERVFTTVALRTPRGELPQPLPIGEHTLTARAIDKVGNMSEDSVAIVIAADSDGDGYTDEEEIELGTDPNDPFDNPGAARRSRSTFGQWQLSSEGRWTRFEISNLVARQATIEITLIRENGQPLEDYPVAINEAAQDRNGATDRRGRFLLRLEGHASATFELRAKKKPDAKILYGYSTIRLVNAKGSVTATFLAHGWIRQGAKAGAAEPAFEGTVVIHGGQPFTLRAPMSRQTKTRPRKPRGVSGLEDLGVLIAAAGKAVLRSNIAGPVPDREGRPVIR